jgi:hypothetical protein
MSNNLFSLDNKTILAPDVFGAGNNDQIVIFSRRFRRGWIKKPVKIYQILIELLRRQPL